MINHAVISALSQIGPQANRTAGLGMSLLRLIQL